MTRSAPVSMLAKIDSVGRRVSPTCRNDNRPLTVAIQPTYGRIKLLDGAPSTENSVEGLVGESSTDFNSIFSTIVNHATFDTTIWQPIVACPGTSHHRVRNTPDTGGSLLRFKAIKAKQLVCN